MSGNCAEILAVGYIKLKDENAALLALIRDLADALEEARTMVNKFSTRSYRNGAEEQREKWLNSEEIIALIARAKEATHGIQSQ